MLDAGGVAVVLNVFFNLRLFLADGGLVDGHFDFFVGGGHDGGGEGGEFGCEGGVVDGPEAVEVEGFGVAKIQLLVLHFEGGGRHTNHRPHPFHPNPCFQHNDPQPAIPQSTPTPWPPSPSTCIPARNIHPGFCTFPRSGSKYGQYHHTS